VCFFATLALPGLVAQSHMAKIGGGSVLVLVKFLCSELPFDRSQNRIFNALPKPNVQKWSVMAAVMKHVIL